MQLYKRNGYQNVSTSVFRIFDNGKPPRVQMLEVWNVLDRKAGVPMEKQTNLQASVFAGQIEVPSKHEKLVAGVLNSRRISFLIHRV